MSDREMALSFFSEVCAPSEFEGMGVCSRCGKANGSCNGNSLLFFGYSGAFRCLVGGFGDIAFVRSDTALLYSMEGIFVHKGVAEKSTAIQDPVRFGTVPANVIMVSNTIPNEKKRFVLQTLLKDTWFDDLYAAKNGDNNLLSTSMQGVIYLRLDGSVEPEKRFDIVNAFNSDPTIDVLLLTTHDWVKGLLKEKKLEMLVDEDMQGNYINEEVEQLIQVALLCTQGGPLERPKMSDVVRMLEGDGLAERWEEWQKEEVFRQEYNHTRQPNADWIIADSTSNLRPDELSGPR
ncbi:unnamed protein product [Camellia sinensis]